MKPIKASDGRASFGGTGDSRRILRMRNRTVVPSANLVKINVIGDNSRSAVLVATKEIPHRTTADKAAKRGSKLDRTAFIVRGICEEVNTTLSDPCRSAAPPCSFMKQGRLGM